MNALTWLALAIAVAIYYGPMQSLLESTTRNKLFRMRDELFDQAASGKTSFQSEQYRAARENLNKLIRFTHMVKWYNVLFLYRAIGHKVDAEEEKNPLYEQFRLRVAITMFGLLVLRSPLLLMMLFPALILGYASSNSIRLKRQILKFVQVVERESKTA